MLAHLYPAPDRSLHSKDAPAELLICVLKPRQSSQWASVRACKRCDILLLPSPVFSDSLSLLPFYHCSLLLILGACVGLNASR